MNRCEVSREELSPMMKQYMEIKDEHPEELLFYRLGDFYELFFEDGIIASRELELTLTGKNAGLKERVPMCGVPYHSVNPYIQKLIEKGYKVAICEQLEDPKTVKGTVKRGVVEVISKGTVVNLESLNEHDNNYIASVLDLEYLYLLTIADISTGELKSLSINHHKDSVNFSLIFRRDSGSCNRCRKAICLDSGICSYRRDWYSISMAIYLFLKSSLDNLGDLLFLPGPTI